MFFLLMYYLGSKNEDEFVSTAVKLDYPTLTKKINNITVAAIWQESNISEKSQRIVLRHLSNFFGIRSVVPEYCIDELGKNHVPPKCDFLYLIVENTFSDKTYFQNFN